VLWPTQLPTLIGTGNDLPSVSKDQIWLITSVLSVSYTTFKL